MLRVSQVFGPAVQGEGPAAGRHCLFVRTFGCNLECSWCDTAYTWAVTDHKAAKTRSGVKYDRDDPALGQKLMSAQDVLASLGALWDVERRPTIIVVSGGEPMMQQRELVPLVEQLAGWGAEIHVETAGTIAPWAAFDRHIAQYTVSPKLANSSNPLSKRRKPEVLAAFRETGRAWLKCVIEPDYERDLEEVDDLVQEVGFPPSRVMVMPEGSDSHSTLMTARAMADAALQRGYGLSLRTHVLLWGDDPSR
ncbi:7-carboxy-7-deazaguanine synthase QueE [Streptomyces xiamenensis]|uniref:7-carboxy-7-deazaguanine synthase QueE n=1 Tax=Streptomyces xiamenensis TaxID=408015 RepID=UPI0036E82553